MSDFQLVSAFDAARLIAGVLEGGRRAEIQGREEDCFANDAFVDLGVVSLHGGEDTPFDYLQSVRKGTYQWALPSTKEVTGSLNQLLAVKKPDDNKDGNKDEKKDAYQKAQSRIEQSLNSLAGAITRLGLIHPRFDPASVEQMVSIRGTTVVADTSSVIQGGLDFVARFLHPAVRMKVPAVVHMEVLNHADNFLKRKRASKSKVNGPALLADHVLSQVAQRTLLSLEMRDDTEIERTPLLGDPLRSAFLPDKSEIAELNLVIAFRSYCDRLILEAARQHQSHSSPGHQVLLLTADQGLARMALAEGISPLFHQTVSADDAFGKTLTGTLYNPVSAVLFRVPLQHVLWELATAFGKARLKSEDGTKWLEVAAMGGDLTWSPVHSRDDLLWVRTHGLDEWLAKPIHDASNGEELDETKDNGDEGSPAPAGPKVKAAAKPKAKSAKRQDVKPAAAGGAGFYRFSVERTFQLLTALVEQGGRMPAARAQELLQTQTPGEYKRFLTSGRYAEIGSDFWTLTDRGLALGDALRGGDLPEVVASLRDVPSIGQFYAAVLETPIGSSMEMQLPDRANSTYRTLGEIMTIGMPIPGVGYVPTYRRPPLDAFVEISVQAFDRIARGDRLVSTGAWLELLAQAYGMHPVWVREALQEANQASMLKVSTEGSTLDRRHDDHSIQVLRMGGRNPTVDTVHLYRGDFLVPNKSSSSIRLERIGS